MLDITPPPVGYHWGLLWVIHCFLVGFVGAIASARPNSHLPRQGRRIHFQSMVNSEPTLASSIDSNVDGAEPEHLADVHRIETCKLVTSKYKKAWFHVVDPADDGLGERWKLNCNINLWRATATSGDLGKMTGTGKPSCQTCTTLWPLHIRQSTTVATTSRTLRGSWAAAARTLQDS